MILAVPSTLAPTVLSALSAVASTMIAMSAVVVASRTAVSAAHVVVSAASVVNATSIVMIAMSAVAVALKSVASAQHVPRQSQVHARVVHVQETTHTPPIRVCISQLQPTSHVHAHSPVLARLTTPRTAQQMATLVVVAVAVVAATASRAILLHQQVRTGGVATPLPAHHPARTLTRAVAAASTVVARTPAVPQVHSAIRVPALLVLVSRGWRSRRNIRRRCTHQRSVA